MVLNVVADKQGVRAAVLIRSRAPVSGLDMIQKHRGQQTEKPILLTGPGKVGQALGLSADWSNHALYSPGGLEVLDGPEPENVLVGPRVGIDYALSEHVAAPWRFAGHCMDQCPEEHSEAVVKSWMWGEEWPRCT